MAEIVVAFKAEDGTLFENLREACDHDENRRREAEKLDRAPTVSFLKLKVGDKVHFQPDDHPSGIWENGIVKRIPEDVIDKRGVWVVYDCDNEWERYWDYSGVFTNLRDLRVGWREK